MSGGFAGYAMRALGIRDVYPPEKPSPTPPLPKVFDVIVDYGDGRRIKTTTYALDAQAAASQMCVVEVLPQGETP